MDRIMHGRIGAASDDAGPMRPTMFIVDVCWYVAAAAAYTAAHWGVAFWAERAYDRRYPAVTPTVRPPMMERQERQVSREAVGR